MKDVVLLLDVDGPLGDFHAEAGDVANKLFDLNLDIEDFVTWDVTDILPTQDMKDRLNAAIAEPGFATRIKPAVGAVDAVRTLKEICEIVYVTTPHPKSPTWMRERQDWLRTHFDVSPDEIIHAFRKYHIKGDVLVDDRPKTIERWARSHPSSLSLLWDMPYNRTVTGMRRVCTWQEVTNAVLLLRGN
jgi:5'(3')-deoxyribonucleotidase